MLVVSISIYTIAISHQKMKAPANNSFDCPFLHSVRAGTVLLFCVVCN